MKDMDEKIIKLEDFRKKLARILTVIITVSSMVILFFLVLFRGLMPSSLIISLFIGLGVGFLLYFITGCNRLTKQYKERFKSIFVEEPFRAVFDGVVYHKDRGLDKEVIKTTDMMMLGNRYHTNDYVMGHYKNVQFERADVLIQQHTSNGKSSHTTTYFHGRWLIFEFNKKFNFDLQIISKGFYYSQKNSTFFTNREERRHKIETEDVNFNENFKVYAQDDHEAYYILTPVFMDVLKNMSAEMDGSFMLGFVDNLLHVAINTKRDAMEPSYFSSIDVYKVNKDVQREIDSIRNIIDGLDLDRAIYK